MTRFGTVHFFMSNFSVQLGNGERNGGPPIRRRGLFYRPPTRGGAFPGRSECSTLPERSLFYKTAGGYRTMAIRFRHLSLQRRLLILVRVAAISIIEMAPHAPDARTIQAQA